MKTVSWHKKPIGIGFALLVLLICSTTILYSSFGPSVKPSNGDTGFMLNVADNYNGQKFQYTSASPLIFVGGFPRSGTTLMRAIIDAHPDVRCGEETRLVPRLLAQRQRWLRSDVESKRLKHAGVLGDALDTALSAFILSLVAKHGEPAKILCNKDPFTMKYSDYLSRQFPNSKYVFMIRDGRAVVQSIISRKVTITGFDLSDFWGCLRKWNAAVKLMLQQCLRIRSKCLIVFYEQLVLHREEQLRRIVKFLGISWTSALLHHEQYINVKGGIRLSSSEKSTDQVVKPIYLDALSKWHGHLPDTSQDIRELAPILGLLGYDFQRPNYNTTWNIEPDIEAILNQLGDDGGGYGGGGYGGGRYGGGREDDGGRGRARGRGGGQGGSQGGGDDVPPANDEGILEPR